jgi:hypothetical protein
MAVKAVFKYCSKVFYTIQIFIPNSTGFSQEGFVFVTAYITYSVISYLVPSGSHMELISYDRPFVFMCILGD